MRFDAAIVGDGPAALTAAILLGRGGARVALLGRDRNLPRRAGETLPGAGLRLLRSLGLPLPLAGPTQRPLSGIASAWHGPGLVEADHLCSPDGPDWLIDRTAFDRGLAAAALAGGAELHHGAIALERSGHGWAIDVAGRSLVADFLIDASGRGAFLSRRLGLERTVESGQIAWWAVASGRSPERLQRPLVERSAGGWWFAVALDTQRTYLAFHCNVPLAAARARSEAWRERLWATRWLAPLLAGCGRFGPVRGCAAGGTRLRSPSGDGWAACGDAAQALDPLSSQGLLSALAGGHMIASALTAAGRARAATLADYDARLDAIWSIYAERRAVLAA